LVCSDAETNCPYIPEAALRISTTYDDPKEFDGTLMEAEKYLERANQIALECLYVFSNVN
jgi:protein-tyrosine phosphatase/arsenate reductase